MTVITVIILEGGSCRDSCARYALKFSFSISVIGSNYAVYIGPFTWIDFVSLKSSVLRPVQWTGWKLFALSVKRREWQKIIKKICISSFKSLSHFSCLTSAGDYWHCFLQPKHLPGVGTPNTLAHKLKHYLCRWTDSVRLPGSLMECRIFMWILSP